MIDLIFKKAVLADVSDIVRLLNDDELGRTREKFEQYIPESYNKAFHKINADPDEYLLIAEHRNNVIGTMQLTFLTTMTYQGGKRMQIEGVRVDKNYQNQGVGQRMFEHAIEMAKHAGCHLVQLTTDKKRPQAIRFYQKLGFKFTHEGVKLIP